EVAADEGGEEIVGQIGLSRAASVRQQVVADKIAYIWYDPGPARFYEQVFIELLDVTFDKPGLFPDDPKQCAKRKPLGSILLAIERGHQSIQVVDVYSHTAYNPPVPVMTRS